MGRVKRTPRPPWCGQCDETSRLVDLPNGMAARCPSCHAAPEGRHDTQAARKRRESRRSLGLTQPDCPLCGTRIYKSHRCTVSVFTGREAG